MTRFATAPALPILVAMVFLAGCESNQGLQGGRFLKNYGQLKQTPTSNGAWVYSNPKWTLERYDRFMLTPLLIRFRPNTQVPVSMQYIDKAEQAYRKAVAGALTKAGLRQSEAPGLGVLTVRGAVTDVHEAGDVKEALRAAMEISLDDSTNNQTIFAMVEPHFAEQPDGTYSRDTSLVFNKWADRLREQLEIARSQTSTK